MLPILHDGLLVSVLTLRRPWVMLTLHPLDMERKGVPFTAMWLKFGNYDSQYDPDYITTTANTASSIYFVTLVVM